MKTIKLWYVAFTHVASDSLKIGPFVSKMAALKAADQFIAKKADYWKSSGCSWITIKDEKGEMKVSEECYKQALSLRCKTFGRVEFDINKANSNMAISVGSADLNLASSVEELSQATQVLEGWTNTL